MLSGLGMNLFLYQGWPGLRASIGGLALGFGVYFMLYMLRAMGAGDVKLMAAVGAMVGWQDWVGIFILTALIGGLASLAVVTLRGRCEKPAKLAHGTDRRHSRNQSDKNSRNTLSFGNR